MEWRIVFTTHNTAEAHIVAGRLRAENIPSILDQEAGGRALGITVGRLGEVRVLVRESDYATATAILDPDSVDELPDSTDPIIYHFGDENE